MEEIRIGMIGNVDSGKSTLTSVLVNNILDDGRGLARAKILKHKHEQESGRTSSITENYLKLNNKKYLSFIDLAGHEKYLKTTMYGLAGHYIDYVMILVGANMGVSRMTREHLVLAITLRIPFIVVVTKIDITPENIVKETVENIKLMVKKSDSMQNITFIVKDENNIGNIDLTRLCPIFRISNKNGDNIDLLKKYIINLHPRYKWDEKTGTNFVINYKYYIKGIGTVVSGKLISGQIKRGGKMLLGPFQGKWIEMVAKSLHDNFKNNVALLEAGESGCIAIKTKEHLNKGRIKRGMVVINKTNQNATREFEADIAILSKDCVTIKKNYQPILNCNTIVQSATLYDIVNEKTNVLRGGDIARVKFRFSFRPEYIREGDKFIFRDGRTKGFGKIIKIL